LAPAKNIHIFTEIARCGTFLVSKRDHILSLSMTIFVVCNKKTQQQVEKLILNQCILVFSTDVISKSVNSACEFRMYATRSPRESRRLHNVLAPGALGESKRLLYFYPFYYSIWRHLG